MIQEIIKKFKFKDNGIILNPPAGFEPEFVKLGFRVGFDKIGKSENTLVFIHSGKELNDFLKKQLKYISPDSVFWIAYPKGTSKIKTDINRDTIRLAAEELGITTVTAISIDDTWSALRFRPIERVGK